MCRKLVFLACALGLAVSPALADIDLQWLPLNQTVYVGDTVGIGLFAFGTDGDDTFNSLQVLMTWDPAFLALTGTDLSGSVGLASAEFTANDSWGFNEVEPPADGDGFMFGYAPFSIPPQELPADPSGSLVATILFTAAAQTDGTLVSMLVSGQKPGRPVAYTQVFSGTSDVLGSIGGPATVVIIPEPATLLFGLTLLGIRRR